MLNPFEAIGNFFKQAGNRWKEKKEARPKAEPDAESRQEARKARRNSELHNALLEAKKAVQVVSLSRLIKGGMERKDIRAMLRRFRAYGVRYMLKERPGTFVNHQGARCLVTRRGKFLPVAVNVAPKNYRFKTW